jgi:hypothetical protein
MAATLSPIMLCSNISCSRWSPTDAEPRPHAARGSLAPCAYTPATTEGPLVIAGSGIPFGWSNPGGRGEEIGAVGVEIFVGRRRCRGGGRSGGRGGRCAGRSLLAPVAATGHQQTHQNQRTRTCDRSQTPPTDTSTHFRPHHRSNQRLHHAIDDVTGEATTHRKSAVNLTFGD